MPQSQPANQPPWTHTSSLSVWPSFGRSVRPWLMNYTLELKQCRQNYLLAEEHPHKNRVLGQRRNKRVTFIFREKTRDGWVPYLFLPSLPVWQFPCLSLFPPHAFLPELTGK
ncbi:hypothetical protein CDAR_4691 [Caerostris darwini]|uniref:Uncharacterized protein n=1 Tax=Caerostris darwini TaxID=1538125 RepID=A0AAV4P9A7_9ARAC|nr:hypothetical protein CDAR_4691 [Caerostris darwini]